MNAFDKVIGYKATKRELLQLCDILLPSDQHHDPCRSDIR